MSGRSGAPGRRAGAGSYRRSLAIGLAVSAAAHAAILGLARWDRPGVPVGEREILLVELPEEDAFRERLERPLEVVRVRLAPAAAAASAGGSASAPPARVTVPAALAAAIPTPRLLLEKVRTRDEEEPPAAAYVSVEDLLIRRGPNPRALRPIDDRPIEVLAAIARAEAGRGGGIRIGGGSGGTCE